MQTCINPSLIVIIQNYLPSKFWALNESPKDKIDEMEQKMH